MEKSKLGLDFEKVKYAKELAGTIANDVQKFVDQYTTVTVERTLCRLIGIDGIDNNDVPLPNVVVNELQEKGVLKEGVL
ncbi:MAG: D-lysine 5,6-aminomutase subunit alpha, partial [Bacteroidales bacterium]|nr:D-lysine 5,6-aminomutase subunit alpha [Bacteroidales bacterium]